MLTSSANLRKKALIFNKQNDGKLFSKQLLTTQKDNMPTEDLERCRPSSLAIPFTWESQPGTPKIQHFRDSPLPPLTPPPSYFYKTPPKSPSKKPSKPTNLFSTIFSKRGRKEDFPVSPASSSPSSSSCSSSAWYSLPSSPGVISASKSFDSSRKYMNECKSPVSTLCFGFGRGSNLRPRGCCASMVKVLLREA